MKKKIFGICVCILILGTYFVVTTDIVQAPKDGDYWYTLSDDVATITGYTGSGGAITIPSTLGGYPTVAIGENAFYNDSGKLITSVIIPNSVIIIDNSGFLDCFSLRSVTIPDSVCTIGNCTFQSCYALSSIIIPNSVIYIGGAAFKLCSSMTSVTIGSGLTTFGGEAAFDACYSLITIDVSMDNQNFASVDGVLYNKAVTNLIQCPGGKTGLFIIPSSVIAIGYRACFDIRHLTSVIIPNSVTTIEVDAFNACRNMTSVGIGTGITTILTRAFQSCTNLSSISFQGLIAPTTVGNNWIAGTNDTIRGHALATSNFPPPGSIWHGLTMGTPISHENEPPNAPAINGPAKGTIGIATEYNFITMDSNHNEVYYFIDWGDQTNSGWIGPYSSGDGIVESHIWSIKGTYTITAKAKDFYGNESDWTIHPVAMPYSFSKPIQIVELLFQRFPNGFPLLRQLLEF